MIRSKGIDERTRRIDNLNFFHITAHLGNGDVCMAYYINGYCLAAREPQILPSRLTICEDLYLNIQVEGFVVNIAAVSIIHYLHKYVLSADTVLSPR